MYWEKGLKILKKHWNTDYGKIKNEWVDTHTEIIELTTGGWSKNEELIQRLSKTMFWYFYWQESKRGGYYLFKKDLTLEEYI